MGYFKSIFTLLLLLSSNTVKAEGFLDKVLSVIREVVTHYKDTPTDVNYADSEKNISKTELDLKGLVNLKDNKALLDLYPKIQESVQSKLEAIYSDKIIEELNNTNPDETNKNKTKIKVAAQKEAKIIVSNLFNDYRKSLITLNKAPGIGDFQTFISQYAIDNKTTPFGNAIWNNKNIKAVLDNLYLENN